MIFLRAALVAAQTTSPTSAPTNSYICCNFDMLDTDNDGLPDFQDEDDDGDSIFTLFELGTDPNNPVLYSAITVDTDGDGIIDSLDTDDDGDTIPTLIETGGDPATATDGLDVPDTDNDGIKDYLDVDDDGDGMLTSVEAAGTGAHVAYGHHTGTTCPSGTLVDTNHCA